MFPPVNIVVPKNLIIDIFEDLVHTPRMSSILNSVAYMVGADMGREQERDRIYDYLTRMAEFEDSAILRHYARSIANGEHNEPVLVPEVQR